MKKEKDLVSIVTISYNHEHFIKDAIEGFLMQRHDDFDIEIIIADDASTDNTQRIIKEYTEKYPNIILPILRKKNVGIKDNLMDALSKARGKYIALCEGDDFWTNDLKLVKQYGLMESNPKATVCFHLVKVLTPDDVGNEDIFPDQSQWSSLKLDDLLDHNFIQTNSVMYKNVFKYNNLIEGDMLPLDWFLHIYHAKDGEIEFIPEVLAVYRRHENGAWWRTEDSKIEFWRKNALKLMKAYDNISKLFSDDQEKREIVAQSRIDVIHSIGGTDVNYNKKSVLEQIGHRYPEFILPYAEKLQVDILSSQSQSRDTEERLSSAMSKLHDSQVDVIQKDAQINALHHELELIRSSKVYKILRKVANAKNVISGK